MPHSFDIIIIGGGIVGLTAALALAQKISLRIALIDSKELSTEWKKNSYDSRVSAISLSSQRIFENIGAWDLIKSKRTSAYKKMQVWDDQGSGLIEFDCENTDENALGNIVEENVMRSSLLEKISTLDNIFLYSSLKVMSIEKNIDSVQLIAEDKKLQTKLLIAADGGNSWVRDQAGILLTKKDYQHTAIVATVRTEHPHQLTARQQFSNNGPLAFLPLDDPYTCSIVWSVSPEYAEILLDQSEENFCKGLTNTFTSPFGKILSASSRYQFPLYMRHAKNYVRARLALVGDAAHTIHPLAGQGVNMGLMDVACLVDVINEAISKNRDFTSLPTLRRYERWRKSDNATMLNIVGGLKKCFSSQLKPIKNWRNLGLSIANKSDFLKKLFIRHAMGFREEMPTLTLKK